MQIKYTVFHPASPIIRLGFKLAHKIEEIMPYSTNK